jgi:serine/threonine protein kinase
MLSIRHNRIMAIIEHNLSCDEPWYAMPLMRGGTLTQYCGGLDPATLHRVLSEIAAAIDHLHARNTIHRDIKPDNVLIDEQGQLAVGDFGLGNDPRYTVAFTMSAMGTPDYAAPEIMKGGEASKASDVFSLGATFFHLATGHVPNQRRDPRLVRRDVPEYLATLVHWMLHPTPTSRPTAGQVIDVLQGRIAAPAIPRPAPRKPAKPKPRWEEVLGAVALVALGVGAAAALSKK